MLLEILSDKFFKLLCLILFLFLRLKFFEILFKYFILLKLIKLLVGKLFKVVFGLYCLIIFDFLILLE